MRAICRTVLRGLCVVAVRRGCVAVGAAGGWFVRVLAVAVGRR